MRMTRLCLAVAAMLFLTIEALAPASALTPNRQKFQACAQAWGQYKTANNVSGRAAYRSYMSNCMKAPAPASQR